MNKTIVTLAEGRTDVVMVSKTNSDNASIMVKQSTMSANDQGFIQEEVRVGFVKGATETLKKLNLKAGDNFSEKAFPIKLVVVEQFEPFFEGQEPKKNPKTDEIITSSGALVYRYTYAVSESSPMVDSKLPTDKVGVTQAQEAKKEIESFK